MSCQGPSARSPGLSDPAVRLLPSGWFGRNPPPPAAAPGKFPSTPPPAPWLQGPHGPTWDRESSPQPPASRKTPCRWSRSCRGQGGYPKSQSLQCHQVPGAPFPVTHTHVHTHVHLHTHTHTHTHTHLPASLGTWGLGVARRGSRGWTRRWGRWKGEASCGAVGVAEHWPGAGVSPGGCCRNNGAGLWMINPHWLGS